MLRYWTLFVGQSHTFLQTIEHSERDLDRNLIESSRTLLNITGIPNRQLLYQVSTFAEGPVRIGPSHLSPNGCGSLHPGLNLLIRVVKTYSLSQSGVVCYHHVSDQMVFLVSWYVEPFTLEPNELIGRDSKSRCRLLRDPLRNRGGIVRINRYVVSELSGPASSYQQYLAFQHYEGPN